MTTPLRKNWTARGPILWGSRTRRYQTRPNANPKEEASEKAAEWANPRKHLDTTGSSCPRCFGTTRAQERAPNGQSRQGQKDLKSGYPKYS